MQGLIEVQNTRPKKFRARKPRLAFKTLLQQKRENMETALQKTIEVASQIEEIISKEIPTAPKERTFRTTAVGVEEAVEMLRLNFEEAEKEICIILQHAYPDDECNLKYSGTTVAKEVINASERGVKIRALLNEKFIIFEMGYLKEQEIKEKIDKVEIRVMKRATPSYFEGF
uniref:Uncharacterized protein n=1 Tax=Candidatus Methanophaga sp. ANME-1 ERB7 TaxID=2759913 RepID=A0A7G9Z9B9_9EURY|nr:hypothetical protein IPLBMFHP_00039 [Methanosarcinales archaeon ANME-1 ERB7]